MLALLVGVLGCSGDDAAQPAPTTEAAPSTATSTTPDAGTSLDDLLLTADDVPEPFGSSGSSDDLDWLVQPLCSGQPDVVIPAPTEIVDARFESPDDDVWLASTVARFDDDGAATTIDAYRSEVDRCAAQKDISGDALPGVGGDATFVRIVNGEGEEAWLWVARVGDVVIEVSVSWWSDDRETIDRVLDHGLVLLETVVARAGGEVTGAVTPDDTTSITTTTLLGSDPQPPGLADLLLGAEDVGPEWAEEPEGPANAFATFTLNAICPEPVVSDVSSLADEASVLFDGADLGLLLLTVGRFTAGGAERWVTESSEVLSGCATGDGSTGTTVVTDLPGLGDEAYAADIDRAVADGMGSIAIDAVVARRGEIVIMASVTSPEGVDVDLAALARTMVQRT